MKRRLVLLPNWMGDAVMAEPALRALAAATPDVEMIGIGRAASVAALRGHTSFANFSVLNDRGLLGPWKAGLALKAFGADEILVLRNSPRSALQAKISGASTRIGFARGGRSSLLTHAITPPQASSPTPAVDDYARLVEAAYDIAIPVAERTPQLQTTAHERLAAATLLEGLTGPIVAIVPGGSKLEKRWPAERFAAVADALSASVVLLGAPNEADTLEAVTNAAQTPVRNLIDRGLSLDSIRGVIERADLLITNDTGPRHLAAALSTPAIVLFGPTDHRWTSLPNVDETLLLSEPFLDASHFADDHAAVCTVDRIAVGDVLVHARRRLASGANQ